MATERRRPLHQRSNSQINAAGIKQTEDVSSSLAGSQSLFHNSSNKKSQHSRTGSFEATTLQTKATDENGPSRRASVTSKRTTKTSRSSSPEKKSGSLILQVVPGPVNKAKKTSRSSSVRSSDVRIPSGPPPYSGPPQDTSTIRFVPRSPSSSSNAPKVTSKRSASTLSSVNNNSDFADHAPSSSSFPLPPAEYTPSPIYSEQEDAPRSKDRKPSISTFATTSSEPKSSVEVNNYIPLTFPPPPPIPETPQAGAFKSTVRLVPHSPLGATPVSNRTRSKRSASSGTRSRSSTTNSAGSRPRSRSSDFHYQRRGSFTQVSRGSSRHSTASYFSSISAIGLPPSRPLPTPPDRSTGLVFQEVAEPLPSPTALPKLPKPILKKARTVQEIEAASPDITPPIDADQFPEIRPALSWILENAPAPLKINKPKRARMQVSPDDEISRATYPNNGGRSFSNGYGRPNAHNGSQWFSESSSSSGGPPAAPPSLNVKNVKGYNPHYWQADGTQSERATVFSSAESNFVLRRDSTNPSYFNAQAVPEWARVYYGRGAPLPNHQEEEDTASDDSGIHPAVRRPQRARIQRINTHLSQTGSVWMGTINPEGRDLQDQFSQPRLDNYPINRSEKINLHLALFCVGFVFPIAWFVGAFYPLPPQKRLARRERQEIRRAVQGVARTQSHVSHGTGPSITHYDDSIDTESLPSFTTFEEGRIWDNAKWWRNTNRVMSVLGLLILGAIIALLVVGLKGRRI